MIERIKPIIVQNTEGVDMMFYENSLGQQRIDKPMPEEVVLYSGRPVRVFMIEPEREVQREVQEV